MKYLKQPVKILVAVALALVIIGGWGLSKGYRATHDADAAVETGVLTQTSTDPNETKPTESCKNYTVKPQEPRFIELPAVQASGCIQKVGKDQHGAVAAPSNVHVAGWYVGSVTPGDTGVSIIDAHVQGKYAEGLFEHLKNIKPGDTIKVQMGDDSWREFTVQDSKSYALGQADEELFKALPGGGKQLTLITCGGTYDKKTRMYEQRVIVRAVMAEAGST